MANDRWGRATSLLVAIHCFAAVLNLGHAVGSDPRPDKNQFVPKISISKETTWATEPVSSKGLVVYFDVINQRYGQGVTPENNAVVSLCRATGIYPPSVRESAEFFKRLGCLPPVENEPRFASIVEWWQATGRAIPKQRFDVVLETCYHLQERPWTTAEFPDCAEWLRSIAEPLELVSDASKCPEFYWPLVTENADDEQVMGFEVASTFRIREIVQALVMRSTLHLGEKRRLRAWTDLMTAHRIARLLGRGPTLLDTVHGIGIENRVIRAELRFLSETHPNAHYVARYREQLNKLPPRSTMADKFDFSERICFLDCCQRIAHGKMSLDEVPESIGNDTLFNRLVDGALTQSTDWNQVQKSGNLWYDRLTTAAKLTTYGERRTALTRLKEEVSSFAKQPDEVVLLWTLTDRPALTRFAYQTLIAKLNSAIVEVMGAEEQCRQRFQNLQIALSISEFHSDYDFFPKSLDVLVPKYLKLAISDLFNDQSVHYEQIVNGYRLYSVGENQVDDQGRSWSDKPRGDDILIEMPVPIPEMRLEIPN